MCFDDSSTTSPYIDVSKNSYPFQTLGHIGTCSNSLHSLQKVKIFNRALSPKVQANQCTGLEIMSVRLRCSGTVCVL